MARDNDTKIEVNVDYLRATRLAYLVKTDKGRELWLPISQVEMVDEHTFLVPTWLAYKEDLI